MVLRPLLRVSVLRSPDRVCCFLRACQCTECGNVFDVHLLLGAHAFRERRHVGAIALENSPSSGEQRDWMVELVPNIMNTGDAPLRALGYMPVIPVPGGGELKPDCFETLPAVSTEVPANLHGPVEVLLTLWHDQGFRGASGQRFQFMRCLSTSAVDTACAILATLAGAAIAMAQAQGDPYD
jgi:hypothetical protein